MKRCISLLLVLGIILGVLVPAAQAAPVEETASVNTDNVTIEGTNGFGNLLSQEITESQEEAEAAEADYPNGYTVTDLVIEGNIATVTYDTMEEATLVVALYTEDGMQMLTSTTATVFPEATVAELTFDGNMPEYFMASAYLLDSYDFSPLCAAYDTPMYTREMQELLASTVEDYDPEKILNLDEDNTTNFAVYAESTIVIDAVEGVNTVTLIDDENATYVIENADEQITSLVAGNVFVYPYAEGEILIVKVAKIEIEGTTATITGTELELEEVFAQMKIESSSETADMTVDDSTAAEGISYVGLEEEGIGPQAWEGGGSASASHTFKVDIEKKKESDHLDASFSVTGSLKVSIDVGFNYYISLKRQYIQFKATPSVNLGVTITGNVTGKYPIGNFGVSPVAGVYIGFSPEIQLKFDGTVEVSANVSMTIGFGYSSDKGFENLTTKPKVTFNLSVEGTLFFGVDFKPNAKIIHEKVASFTVGAVVGFELTAKMSGTMFEYFESDAEKKHTCTACLGLDVDFKATLDGELKFLNCDWLTLKVKVADLTFDLGSWHRSSEEDSFKKGECKNYTYRLTIFVTDNLLRGIPDISVAEKSGDNWGTTNEHGAVVHYVPEGQYTIQAVINGEKISKTVDVEAAMLVAMNVLHDKVDSYKGIFDGIPVDDTVDYGSIKASGYYGNNIRWTLYSGGTLTIEGQGKMDHAFLNGVPWADYRSLIKEIVIYDGVTDIGGSVFQFCENLYSVKIPDSVTEIGSYAFRNCTSLKSITIPDSVTNTWGYIFQDCTSLSDVTLGNSLTDIYDGMFQNCNSLTSIEIPDSVTSIGKLAFYECDNLSRVTIGKSVNYMGENSFTWCTKLRTIIFKGNAPTFYSGLFYHVTATAYYPANNSTWTSSVRRDYDGKITWKPYNSLADIPLSGKPISTVELLSNGAMEVITPQAVYPGDYSTKVTKDYILKTASFSNLVPNQQYVLFSMIEVSTQDPLVPSNLLYVDQAVAEADGTLTFDYVQREVHDVSYVFVCGASNKDLKNAEISFSEMSADGALQVVNPTIIYNGKLLIEGQDYVVVGTVDFSEAGEYTCYIRGIRNYTGFVECDYTVDGHSHSFTNFISNDNASCTNDGTMTAKCDSCDAIRTIIDEGSALGHSFGDWTVIQEPTTTENGVEEHICTRCGHAEQRSIAKLENPFNDVAPGSFFYEPVMWAIENGITNGTSATTFGPNDQCMRAHVVTFLWRAVGSPEPTRTDNPFVDVKPTDFYYKPVLWAVENGITAGMDATHFGPTAYCNRAQVVTFLYRTMGNPTVGAATNPFTDVAAGSFYERAVLWAVENGVTAGLSATSFGPNSICNRAQIVTFLYRAFVD